jgi:hypothetical protein
VVEPPLDGWHDTGDIVAIDRDGFLTIKGRAKRFAKIGGEMVSLAAIEALAADLWPEAMSVAVARPDAGKGERIILLTTAAAASRTTFLAEARASGASELMVPAEIVHVDALPLLGSGKVDTIAAAKLVAERQAPLGAALSRRPSSPPNERTGGVSPPFTLALGLWGWGGGTPTSLSFDLRRRHRRPALGDLLPVEAPKHKAVERHRLA